jgi:hypothetical protein
VSRTYLFASALIESAAKRSRAESEPASGERGDADIASSYDGIGALDDGEARAGIEMGWVVEGYAADERLDVVDDPATVA